MKVMLFRPLFAMAVLALKLKNAACWRRTQRDDGSGNTARRLTVTLRNDVSLAFASCVE
jgi:hypothetical protein